MSDILRIPKNRKDEILKKSIISFKSIQQAKDNIPDNAILCYVDSIYESEEHDQDDNSSDYKVILYYTTNSLDKQWGDDWNDSPYEHNAGTPYSASIHYYSNGDIVLDQREWNIEEPKFIIYTVEIMYSELKTVFPNEYILFIYDNGDIESSDLFNSPYSVSSINNGAIPWLRKQFKSLYAGTNFNDLIEFIGKG